MVIKGFIKEVGSVRDWTGKDGNLGHSVKLTLAVPYVTKDGTERNDELIGEMNFGNTEFLEGLKKTSAANERCEFQVGFSLSEWNGRKIQNIRVYNVSKMVM